MEENPYCAVHVVWMQQERGTNHWLYAYEQTDPGESTLHSSVSRFITLTNIFQFISVCSPWDLELSTYVLEANIKPPVVPRALLVGTLNPSSVIEFLKT